MNREILVAVHAVDGLEKTVRRLARVAAKLKLSPLPSLVIDWSKKEERTRTHTTGEVIDTGRGADVKTSTEIFSVMVVPCVITLPDSGEVRASSGWKFVGTLTRTDAGLETMAGCAKDLPTLAAYRDRNRMECDHCRANRNRTKTIIVRDDFGALKQVGRECAHNYLTDVAQVLGELEFQASTFTLLPGEEFADDEDFWGGWAGGRVLQAWPVEFALPFIVRKIRDHGFVKSSETDDHGNTMRNEDATWRVALKLMTSSRPEAPVSPMADQYASWTPDDRLKLDPFVLEDYKEAFDAFMLSLAAQRAWDESFPTDADKATAATLIEWIEGQTIDPVADEFLANLQDLVTSGFVSERKMAFLAALPGAKDRADREAKRKAMEAARSEPAPEGRVAVTGTVISTKTRQTDWGTSIKWLVELDNGCRVWSTIPAEKFSANPDERVTFVATFERSERDQFFAFGSRPTMKLPKEKKPRRAKATEPVAA